MSRECPSWQGWCLSCLPSTCHAQRELWAALEPFNPSLMTLPRKGQRTKLWENNPQLWDWILAWDIAKIVAHFFLFIFFSCNSANPHNILPQLSLFPQHFWHQIWTLQQIPGLGSIQVCPMLVGVTDFEFTGDNSMGILERNSP